MFRFLLYSVLLILFVRAMSRLWHGFVVGVNGGVAPGRGQVPQRGVQMVRDPVCGTFIVPNRSLTLTSGPEVLHFCSSSCRDQYAASHPAARRGDAAHSRTA